MDKFPIFYPLHLHILNKITTFVRAHWRDKTIRNATIAVEVAASAKFFSISVYRTLEAVNPQLAATLFTFAATFCSIIIETQKRATKLFSHRHP